MNRGTIDMNTNKPVLVPQPYSAIIDLCAARDRETFEDNPELTQFQRDMVAGEFWPHEFPAGSQVRVTYVAPGLRLREPIIMAPGDPALN